MADDYTGVFRHIQEQTHDLLAADAELLTGSGVRIECKRFDNEPLGSEFEYADYELPAIAPLCGGMSRDEDLSIGGKVEATFLLTVFVITEVGEEGERMTLCQDIAAKVIQVMLAQYGANQLSGLDLLVDNADSGSVVTHLDDVTFEESGGRDGDEDEQPYRALATIDFSIAIDILR